MAEREKKYATAIRFDPDLYERLREAATELGVPIGWLVNRLVAEGLEAMLPADEIRLTQRVNGRG